MIARPPLHRDTYLGLGLLVGRVAAFPDRRRPDPPVPNPALPPKTELNEDALDKPREVFKS